MNNRYLIVKDNVVVNVIVWSGDPYFPDRNTLMMPSHEHPEIGIGWQLIDGVWTAPPEPEPEQTPEQIPDEVIQP